MVFLEPEQHCGNKAGNGGMVECLRRNLPALIYHAEKEKKSIFFWWELQIANHNY
jgi:hypothetical protein